MRAKSRRETGTRRKRALLAALRDDIFYGSQNCFSESSNIVTGPEFTNSTSIVA